MALFMLVAQASSLDVTKTPGARARVVLSAVENTLLQDYHGTKVGILPIGMTGTEVAL